MKLCAVLLRRCLWLCLLVADTDAAYAAAEGSALAAPAVPFLIFGATLAGVAILHRHTLPVALTGLFVACLHRAFVLGEGDAGLQELAIHFAEEWVTLTNLLLLLLGFALLSNQFERSNVPEALPAVLPDGWRGGLALLALVFVLSAFLDNIAAAVIGGVMARHVYAGKVSIGFQASVVAAANAGGSGSVIGDPTTTMMWIEGVSPLELLPAYIGAVAAVGIFGILGARQQHGYQPIVRDPKPDLRIDHARVAIVFIILAAVVATNVIANAMFPELLPSMPALGLGLWAAIIATSVWRMPDWHLLPRAFRGALFLIALVALASLMPVERLPPPSTDVVLGLGFLSAVFDNIPLTALALNQGGHDWALLAYAVGFGGSMIWVGSSAGVAITTLYPEARSVGRWLKYGWYIPIAYVVGFFAIVLARAATGYG